jgi:hypothetical protein
LPWSQVSEVFRFTQRVGEIWVSDVFAGGRRILEKASAVDTVANFPGMPRPTTVCVTFVLPEKALLAHEELASAAIVGSAVH